MTKPIRDAIARGVPAGLIREAKTMLLAALLYIQYGWAVFPLYGVKEGRCTCGDPSCSSPGKHPRTKHGLKDASLDEEQVSAWWERNPDANIGLAVPENALVLDIDDLKAMQALKHNGIELPTTSQVSTGRGLHLYYRLEPGHGLRPRVNALKDIVDGVDVRTAGSYVVASPSVHINGTIYEFGEGSGLISEAPEALLEKLRAPVPQEGRPLDVGPVLGGVPEGQRNDYIFRLASRYRALKLRPAEAEVLVLTAARGCQPPLPEDEALKCLESARRYPAGRSEGPSDEPPFRSLAEILEDPRTLEPPIPVVPRLCWMGRTTMLAAREKDGKSTLAGAAASAVSRGADFLEGPARQGVVLWLGLEEHPGEMARRFNRFGVDPELVLIATRLDRPFEQLEKATAIHQPALIVVDTLASFVERILDDPNRSTAWTVVMNRFARLAHEYDAAILFLHHGRKKDGQYRDSTAIGAGVDVIIEMKRGKHEANVRELAIKGRFDIPETSIRFNGIGFGLVSGQLSLEERICNFVRLNPGANKRRVRQGVTGRDEEIGAVIDDLVVSGALENQGTAGSFSLHVPVKEE